MLLDAKVQLVQSCSLQPGNARENFPGNLKEVPGQVLFCLKLHICHLGHSAPLTVAQDVQVGVLDVQHVGMVGVEHLKREEKKICCLNSFGNLIFGPCSFVSTY